VKNVWLFDGAVVEWVSGEVEDSGGTGGQAVLSISGPGRSCKMGPDGVFPVSLLLSISGLSGIYLLARPAGGVSSISGGTVLGSGLVAPTNFSGTKDFERPAREWDRNTILLERGGTTFSGWSRLSSDRTKVAAEPGGEASQTGGRSGRSGSLTTLDSRDIADTVIIWSQLRLQCKT